MCLVMIAVIRQRPAGRSDDWRWWRRRNVLLDDRSGAPIRRHELRGWCWRRRSVALGGRSGDGCRVGDLNVRIVRDLRCGLRLRLRLRLWSRWWTVRLGWWAADVLDVVLRLRRRSVRGLRLWLRSRSVRDLRLWLRSGVLDVDVLMLGCLWAWLRGSVCDRLRLRGGVFDVELRLRGRSVRDLRLRCRCRSV